MTQLNIILREPSWPDLDQKIKDGDVIHLGADSPPIQVAGLTSGMRSGAPSVAIRIDLPDGKTAIAETSLKLFLTAADALKARFGDPR